MLFMRKTGWIAGGVCAAMLSTLLPATSLSAEAATGATSVTDAQVSTVTSSAAGAQTVYDVSFTASNPAGFEPSSTVTVTFPSGTGVSTATGTMSDVRIDRPFGTCTPGSGTSVVCTMSGTPDSSFPIDAFPVPPGLVIVVSLSGIVNPPAGSYTATVATSVDTAPATSGAYSITAAQSVGNTAATAVTDAAGAPTTSSVMFTTSSTGALSAAAGSSITVSAPAGLTLTPAGAVVTDTTSRRTVGGCTASGQRMTCPVPSSSPVSAGDVILVSGIGVVNPASGSYAFTVTTTSDTVSATASVSTVGDQSVTAAAATTLTMATGARTDYGISFTTSSSGGLSGAAGSVITVEVPDGISLTGTSASASDVTTNSGIGGCGANNQTLTCPITPGATTIGGDALRVAIAGVVNPAAGAYSFTVSTSSDTVTATSSAITIVAAQSVVDPAAAVSSSTAAGALTAYDVTFTTSSTGALAGDANGTITVTAPNTVSLNGVTALASDLTTGNQLDNCTISGETVTCGVPFGEAVAAGDEIDVNLGGVTNPAVGTYSFGVATTSDTASAQSSPLTVVAAQPVTAVGMAFAGSAATGANTAYDVTFTTSSTGALSGNNGASISVTLPAGTGLTGFNTFVAGQDVTNGQPLFCSTVVNGQTITCRLQSFDDVAAGDKLSVEISGLVNPPVGSDTLTVFTSSDPSPVASGSYQVVAANPVTGVAVQFNGSSAAGALTSYGVDFVSSATGDLSSAAGSTVTVVLPSTANDSGATGSLSDANGNLGPCIGEAQETVTCFVTTAAGPNDQIHVEIDGITNPPAGSDTVTVSTSSDQQGTSPSFTIGAAAGPLTNPTVTPSNPTASALSSYTFTLTTSTAGQLLGSAGSSISVALPAGTGGSPQCVSATDITTSLSLSCNVQLLSSTLVWSLVGGDIVNGGDTIQLVVGGLVNPAAGSLTAGFSTTSDLQVVNSASYTIASSTTISGTVVDGNGNPLPGAPVQACPASGPCQTTTTASDGTYTVGGISNGPYAVSATSTSPRFPGTSNVVNLTIANLSPATGIALTIATFEAVPPGVTVTSGGTSVGAGGSPSVSISSPLTVTAPGCTGGYGVLIVSGTNEDTGLPDEVAATMVETPAGSGNYVGTLPNLGRIHGATTTRTEIVCPQQKSKVYPTGGPPSGGTDVLVFGSGFSSATAVAFGGQEGQDLDVLDDSTILVMAPAGTGEVSVTVTTASGTTTVGQYQYFGVTGASVGGGPATGSASGGTTVTITGTGFANVAGVMFGPVPATSWTLISPTEIQAVSPPGVGTVDIQVICGYGMSPITPAATFSYTGGPAGTGTLTEGTGPNALTSFDGSLLDYCNTGVSSQECQDVRDYLTEEGPELVGEATGVTGLGMELFARAVTGQALDEATVETLIELFSEASLGDAELDALTGLLFFPEVVFPIIGALSILGLSIGIFKGVMLLFQLWSDPSGTVVDTNDDPISGATVTLLQEGNDGSFAPASTSGLSPPINPQVTPATGAYEWNVQPGVYEVVATAPNCHAPGQPGEPDVTSPAVVVPPPAIGLTLTMQCGAETLPTPAISGVGPTTGSPNGGTLVDITGSGFGGATAIYFGASPAESVNLISDSEITAVSPPGTGSVDISVTTPGGTSTAVAADQFSYQAVPTTPTISNLPSSGIIGGGFSATVGTTGDGATSVTSNSTGICTVSGLVVSYVSVGTCSLTAHVAAGTYSTAADGVPQIFAISGIGGGGGGGGSSCAPGATSCQSENSTTPGGSATATNAGTTATASDGQGTITVSQYGSDPVGALSNGTGEYFDVALSAGNTFTSVTIIDTNLNGGTSLMWWNGSVWLRVVGNPGPTYTAGPPPSVSVTLDSTTSPTLAQLTGTVFAVTSSSLPGPPTSLTATPGNGSASFAWGATSSNGTAPVISYTVTCAPSGAVTTSAMSATISGLTNGTVYTCRVAATNSVGTGPSSPSVTVTPTAPGPPGPSSPCASYSGKSAFVCALYEDLLRRAPDQGGLRTRLAALSAGMSRNQVALSILNSTEYRTDYINSDYESWLGRPVDPGGLSTWLAAYNAGATEDQVDAGILGSAEFFKDSGSTNNGFVNSLYRALFHRPVDGGGQATWGSVLANGVRRTQVALAIDTSHERHVDDVTFFYDFLLNRPVDGGGLSTWVRDLDSGVTDQTVIAGIVGSPEFYKNAPTV